MKSALLLMLFSLRSLAQTSSAPQSLIGVKLVLVALIPVMLVVLYLWTADKIRKDRKNISRLAQYRYELGLDDE